MNILALMEVIQYTYLIRLNRLLFKTQFDIFFVILTSLILCIMEKMSNY